MDTQVPGLTSSALDGPAEGCTGTTGGGRRLQSVAGARPLTELSREVAALTAQLEAQALETAALRRELTELRSSLDRELRTQKIVLVDEHQTTTVSPGSIWLSHRGFNASDDGSPRPGSGLGLAASDTWTGILCSIEAAGLPQLSADLVATVEQEPYAGVVCHFAETTRAFRAAAEEGR